VIGSSGGVIEVPVLGEAAVEAKAIETLKAEKRRVPKVIARSTNLALALVRLEREIARNAGTPFVQANAAELQSLVTSVTSAIVGDRATATEIVQLERRVREEKAGTGVTEGKALGLLWLLIAVPALAGASLWGFLSYQETKRAEEVTRQADVHRQVAALKLRAIQEGASDGIVRSLASIEDAVLGRGATVSLAVGTGAALGLLAVLFGRPRRGAG
jgi:hypothetical protein